MAIKSSNQITFTEHKKIIEIKEYYLATSIGEGVTTETDGWTTDIQTINYTDKYLWNYEEVVYSIGSSEISEPVIIGFYGQGTNGKGIDSIINYYSITRQLEAPDINDEDWELSPPLLSPTNKYLWNYEKIIYTDGAVSTTEPALIGVYGDNGADAVTFEIYSVNGFTFKEDMNTIELKVAAFVGGDAITDATYTWEWWNNNIEGYDTIVENTSEPKLIVTDVDAWALASLKCTMSYQDKTYEDYVVLTKDNVIYTSMVKFFDGSNIFTASDSYLVAYIEVYQNNHKVETISADSYCSGISSVDDNGLIISTLNQEFPDGDKMYFICINEHNTYEAILGEYKNEAWHRVDYNTKYTYQNTLHPNSNPASNVVVISKERVNKSENVDFTVYLDNVQISTTNTMVIDSNDPIVSDSAPVNPVYNQLWVDTSMTPNALKIFVQIDGKEIGEWVNCTDKAGTAIYTSRPSSYNAGDLWILASGEICGDFGVGSMLKSTTTSEVFSASHWIDADSDTTELKKNIKQYLKFDTHLGLKIGQHDEKFYVNIGATEMGFYDNTNNQNQKVVSISNNAATIKNLTVQDDATFDCNAEFNKEVKFGNFVWKIESNGSLSLA